MNDIKEAVEVHFEELLRKGGKDSFHFRNKGAFLNVGILNRRY